MTVCRTWLLAALLGAAACGLPGNPQRPVGSEQLRQGLRIVVMSDLNSRYGSTAYEPEVGQVIARTVEEWRPDLVLIAGDMVAGQSPALDDARVRAMWAAFDSVVAAPLRRAGIPLAFTLGNHDASGHAGHHRDRLIAADHWLDHRPALRILDGGRYPFYYAFTHGGAFFLVLDASTGVVVGDSAQMAWLRRALDRPEARAAELRISLGHVPLYAVAEGRNRPGEVQGRPDSLRAVLEAGGVRLHISGHHHTFYPGRRGRLELLHAGALGQGPRRLLGTSVPPSKTVTVLDMVPAADFLSERTFRVRGDRFTIVDPDTLPARIDGINGSVVRRAREDRSRGGEPMRYVSLTAELRQERAR